MAHNFMVSYKLLRQLTLHIRNITGNNNSDRLSLFLRHFPRVSADNTCKQININLRLILC